MLRDQSGKHLWIETETGEFEPVESHGQIHSRKRGPGVPDWWVVAKDPGWRPASPGSRKEGGGCVSKPNFGGELQACTPDGRYTFDRGSGSGGPGGIVESDEDLDGWGDFIPPKRGRASRMGDLIRAEQRKGQGRGSVFARGAGLGKSLLADAGTVLQDGSEAFSTKPLPDDARTEIWSQSQGELKDISGQVLETGYAGAGGPNEKGAGRNNPGREAEVNVGPPPKGLWKIEEITDPNSHRELGRPVFRLVPDKETRERVKAMGRDPDSFLIHGDNKTDNASKGCIIMDKPARERLKKRGVRFLRVEE